MAHSVSEGKLDFCVPAVFGTRPEIIYSTYSLPEADGVSDWRELSQAQDTYLTDQGILRHEGLKGIDLLCLWETKYISLLAFCSLVRALFLNFCALAFLNFNFAGQCVCTIALRTALHTRTPSRFRRHALPPLSIALQARF